MNIQAADALMGIFGFKRVEKKMTISLRKSINEKCKDCTYDPLGEGNWRQQTMDCRVKLCPLWPVRPISKPRKTLDSPPQSDVA